MLLLLAEAGEGEGLVGTVGGSGVSIGSTSGLDLTSGQSFSFAGGGSTASGMSLDIR